MSHTTLRNYGITLLAALLTMFALFLLAGVVHADQPTCTGDRHYDSTGQCCPVVDPPATTTTTLPGDPPQACPPVAPCQPVTCVCDSASGANTGTVNVNVNRCPDAPVYQACFTLRPGQKLLPHDKTVVYDGVTYVCPRRVHAHRFFVPQS